MAGGQGRIEAIKLTTSMPTAPPLHWEEAMEGPEPAGGHGRSGDRVLVSFHQSVGWPLSGKAAGAIEAVATVMSKGRGCGCHPTSTFWHPYPSCALISCPWGSPGLRPIRSAASNSFGFGGINASIVFGEPGD